MGSNPIGRPISPRPFPVTVSRSARLEARPSPALGGRSEQALTHHTLKSPSSRHTFISENTETNVCPRCPGMGRAEEELSWWRSGRTWPFLILATGLAVNVGYFLWRHGAGLDGAKRANGGAEGSIRSLTRADGRLATAWWPWARPCCCSWSAICRRRCWTWRCSSERGSGCSWSSSA